MAVGSKQINEQNARIQDFDGTQGFSVLFMTHLEAISQQKLVSMGEDGFQASVFHVFSEVPATLHASL